MPTGNAHDGSATACTPTFAVATIGAGTPATAVPMGIIDVGIAVVGVGDGVVGAGDGVGT